MAGTEEESNRKIEKENLISETTMDPAPSSSTEESLLRESVDAKRSRTKAKSVVLGPAAYSSLEQVLLSDFSFRPPFSSPQSCRQNPASNESRAHFLC